MLQAHQRLGDFEIIRLLGKGGMGEVYEAQQLNPPRRVALKVLSPWLAEDDKALERFWREAAVPARLDHPSIVRIIATGRTDDGVAYYTMQLVRGLSLADLIRQAADPSQPPTVPQATTPEVAAQDTPSEAGLPPAADCRAAAGTAPPLLEQYRQDRFRAVARIGAQAARALASAHRQGVLHRDIKPSNLMVDQYDHLYVVDFGLTRALSADATGTRAGGILGTPWYMSPEQARGEPIDARSDLYALGVTLYELVTGGKGPFTASRTDADAVLRQVKSGQALPLHVLAPDVPAELERILHRAIHPRAARRYPDADALAADLERFCGEMGPSRGRGGRAGRRRLRATPVLGVGAALALAVGLSVGLWPRGGAQPPGPPPPAPPVRRTDELPPLPEVLRNRVFGHRMDLLKNNLEPLWAHKLLGEGFYTRQQRALALFSAPRKGPTLLALDNDPRRRWFEFAVDVQPVRSRLPAPLPACGAAAVGVGVPVPGGGPWAALPALAAGGGVPDANRAGVFFGWRRGPGGEAGRFFVLQFAEPPLGSPAPGRLVAGHSRFEEARGARGSCLEWCCPFRDGQGVWTLPPAGAGGWRRVSVRAVDHRVAVSVDGVALGVLDVDRLRAGLGPAGEGLDPRGALGVWASQGVVSFRGASITALPPGPEKP